MIDPGDDGNDRLVGGYKLSWASSEIRNHQEAKDKHLHAHNAHENQSN